MPDALLHVDNLSLVTTQGYIARDISFFIKPAEIVALTGKSGSGKTSIAMAIMGLFAPGIRLEQGRITWHGTTEHLVLPDDISKWTHLRGTQIAFIQQDVYGAFDPVLKMGSQMIMVIRERSINIPNDPEQTLRNIMQEVGLKDIDRLWNSYPHQLSGGQLQRCLVSMAVVLSPKLLIADEPTSAIDKIHQQDLLDVFKTLRSKYGMAILCITHDRSFVKYLADREIEIGERSTQTDMPLQKREVPENDMLIHAIDLVYQYKYGGLFEKAGATIGPLTFKLQKGSCLGVIGQSGSGKSTIAQLLVGLLQPTSGKFQIDNHVIDFKKNKDIDLLRSRVQMVFQDGRGSLHPYFTVRKLLNEVVEFYQRYNGIKTSSLRQVIEEVGLPENLLDRKPSSLSGGECLRVCIARALLMQPGVLVCDESTSALDEDTRDGILNLLRNLMESHAMSIVFISHDEHVIRMLADNIMVLHEGRVVETGHADEVINYPTHPVTKKIFAPYATIGDKGHL